MVLGHLLIHLLFATHLILASLLAWRYAYHRIGSNEVSKWQYRPARHNTIIKKIALICPRATAAVLRLKDGLETSLNAKEKYTYIIDLLEGHDRNSLTRHQVRTALRADYACLVTAGLFSTQLTQEVLAHSKNKLPLIFGDIAETENHIIQHPIAHQWTTGVLHERDMASELTELEGIIPTAQKVLLVQPLKAFRWIERDAQAILHYFNQKDIPIATYRSIQNSSTAIVELLEGCNMLIILPKTLEREQFKQIANYCSRVGITLYTSDIDAVKYGAAIGSGGGQSAMGTAIGEKIKLIVQCKMPPHHIPISTITPTPTVRLNRKVISSQLLPLSDDNLFVIDRGQTHQAAK